MAQIDFSFLMGISRHSLSFGWWLFSPSKKEKKQRRRGEGGGLGIPYVKGREKQVYNISHTRLTWKTRNFIDNGAFFKEELFMTFAWFLHWRKWFMFFSLWLVHLYFKNKEGMKLKRKKKWDQKAAGNVLESWIKLRLKLQIKCSLELLIKIQEKKLIQL